MTVNLRQRVRLRTRVQQTAARAGWHLAPASRFDLTRRDFYSPIPDYDAVPQAVWDGVSPMHGIEFDVDEQFEWAERELAPYAHEFQPPLHGDPHAPHYFLVNGSYQAGDGDVLRAMLRHLKPTRVVELGSGFSTFLIHDAIDANARDGRPAEVRTFDPLPPDNIRASGHAVQRLPAQDVPLDVMLALEAGDVLFVDTTHTVKVGSEVNRIVLDVLPRLAPGVVVHFHDVVLPYEYPRWLLEDNGAWAEQYLLQAFLSGNDRYRPLLGVQAMARTDPDRLARVAPQFNPREHFPMAFWMISR